VSTLSFDGVTSHTLKIDEVTTNSVTITISSDPVTVTLKVGETVTVDLNKDGIMDMEITLDSVMGKATDIVIVKLTGADIVAKQDTDASKQKFSLSKKEIRTEITQGETVTETFRIRNDGIETLALDLEVSPELKGYVVLNKDSIILDKGESQSIDVNFLAPATLEPKLYVGKIIIGTDLKQLSLPIQITVKKREALFDVKVKIPDKFKTVYPGESVFADITLLNIGKIGQVDVEVDYSIKNPEGAVIASSKETIGVEVATSFTKTLTLPTDVISGNYTYSVSITYKDTSTTGEDYFLVKSKISYIPTVIQERLTEVLVWVFGTALLFTIYFLIRSRYKEKFLEKEEREDRSRIKQLEQTVKKKK
ncbi:MAG: hypothetical protein Q8N77_02665, partial [Nanoarchaeota archaeon]|nr:hypothetical protein [Nanoarchaeota archaeon]